MLKRLLASCAFGWLCLTHPLAALESHTVIDAVTVAWRSDADTAPFRLHATWRSGAVGEKMDPVVARLIAPDGTVVERLETEGKTTLEWNVEVATPQPGLYRLVWTALKGVLSVSTEPGLPEAVSAHAHGWVLPEGSRRFFFVVPPGLAKLSLTMEGGSVSVEDESGKRRGEGAETLEVDLGDAKGQLWSLETRVARKGVLRFGGAAPLLLAATPEAARAVGDGVTVLPGGVLCFHPWQVEAWKLLETYRKLPPEAFEVPLPDLAAHAAEWEKEPARNAQLFGGGGSYANLRPILAAQNLDPASPWFGSINVWREFDGGARKNAPVFFYRREDAFADDFRSGTGTVMRRNRGGLGVHQAREASHLAAVYQLKAPFNPLYHHPALLRRTVIGILADLMMIRPSELVEPMKNGYYGGNRAFHFSRITQAYSLIGPALPEAEQRVIGQGMRAIADRHLVGRVGLVTNQWLSIPMGIYHVYLGSGDEHYRDWTRRHLRWIMNGDTLGDGERVDKEAGGGLQPAGYHTEAGGPDATYNGITLTEFAQLVRELGDDPEMVEAMRKSYHFFNHTIVPHPFDPWERGFGSYDFSHRTPGSWWESQVGGGILYASDLLPEAGLRAGIGWFIHPQAPDALARFRKVFHYNPENFFDLPSGGASRIGGTRLRAWKFFPKDPKKGEYPAREKEPFFRSFANEFFAVRRGDYYVLIYAGNTRPQWMRKQAKADLRAQDVQNGGGISLLWSEDLGPSLLGTNYGAWGAHSLIARQGEREFRNDYRGTRVEGWDADAWTLTVAARMDGLPLDFRRHYRFLPEGIEVELTIEARDAVKLDAFEEALPLTNEPGFRIQAIGGDRLIGGEPVEGVATLELQTRQKPGVHRIALDPARRVDLRSERGVSYRKGERKLEVLALDLPLEWKAGQREVRRMRFSFGKKEL